MGQHLSKVPNAYAQDTFGSASAGRSSSETALISTLSTTERSVRAIRPRTCLSALPADILLEIASRVAISDLQSFALYASSVSRIEECYDIRPPSTSTHPLIPLSMTCRRLRILCLPTIFKFLTVTDLVLTRSLQLPSVLAQIQIIHIRSRPSTLEAIISAATNLREIRCAAVKSVQPFLFVQPTLTDITLLDASVNPATALVLTGSCSFRAFRMVFENRWNRIPVMRSEHLQAEWDFIQSALLQSRLSLEVAMLPGESTRYSFLASRTWPALRELALVGAYPADAATVPILEVLSMLPRLRILTLAMAPRRREHVLYVWPPGAKPTTPPDLTQLTHLSLAFPREDDAIFQQLSPALTELALRETPRFHTRYPTPFFQQDMRPDDIGHAAPGPLLTCSGAQRIFSTLPHLANLQRLELVIQADDGPGGLDVELAMYALIAATCPHLRLFELHRCRVDNVVDYDPSAVPVAALTGALEPFKALRELRLNIRLAPYNFWTDAPEVLMPWTAKTVKQFAEALPWLEYIFFLERRLSKICRWTVWVVSKVNGEVVVAETEDRGFQGELSSI